MYQTFLFQANLTDVLNNDPFPVLITLDSLYQRNNKIKLTSLNVAARYRDATVWKNAWVISILKGLPGVTQNIKMEDVGGWAAVSDATLDGLLLETTHGGARLPDLSKYIMIDSSFTLDIFFWGQSGVSIADLVEIFVGVSYDLVE